MDIYNYKKQLDQEAQRLQRAKNILPANRKHIERFSFFCDADDSIGNARRLKYRMTMRKIASMVKKDFKKMNRRDIEKLMAEIN